MVMVSLFLKRDEFTISFSNYPSVERNKEDNSLLKYYWQPMGSAELRIWKSKKVQKKESKIT